MFSFKPKTDEEKIKARDKENEIKQRTEDAALSLQHCLQSDSFIKYRNDLENAHKGLIKVGIGILRDIKSKDERVTLYDALFVRAELLGLLLERVMNEKAK